MKLFNITDFVIFLNMAVMRLRVNVMLCIRQLLTLVGLSDGRQQPLSVGVTERNADIPEWQRRIIEGGKDRLPRNYQLFAAEDEGRSEDPTQRRLQDEREKGRLPRSQELPSALVTFFAIVMIYMMASSSLTGLAGIVKKFLGQFNEIGIPQGPNDLGNIFYGVVWEVAKIMMPVFAVVVVVAILGNIIQGGFVFSLQPLMLNWEKMKPNFGKLLFSRQAMVNLLKAVVKMALILSVSLMIIGADFYNVLTTSQVGLGEGLSLVAWTATKLIIVASAIFILLAIPDYLYQRFEFMESLKMTIQDVKREAKDADGNMFIKQKQRERMREIVASSMLNDVPDASVIITNPEHYSVALKYDLGSDPAPKVVAKGIDSLAFTIRRIAKENGVEIIPNPPLARALYKDVEIGQFIPPNYFNAVVSVFQSLQKFKETAGARQ